MIEKTHPTSEIVATNPAGSLVSIDSTSNPLFKPTAAMRIWVAESINSRTVAISKIADNCGVDRKNWYIWIKKPGFLEWYEQERQRGMTLVRAQLDSIGLKKAESDFRYFELMQKISGRDVSRETPPSIAPPGSPVQVNFNSNKYIRDRS